jgi:3-oxoadipate enol-lactonase
MLSILAVAALLQVPDTGRTPSGIAYSVLGRGPDVVFIHGSNLDSRSWGTLPVEIAKTHRVILIDQRSHGLSSDATGPFSWQDDAVEVLNAVGSRQAVLIGHSLGAQVAVDVALGHPDRVRALVLIGPGIGGKPLSKPPVGFDGLIAALRAGDFAKAGVVLSEMPVMTLYGDTTSAALARRIVRENVRLFRASPQWVRPATPPANDRLESLRLPLLVLMGAADPTESNEAGRVLLARVAGATGRTFPVCGHMVPLDCPVATLKELQSFLARL